VDASFAIADLFKVGVKLDPSAGSKADHAVREAARHRGLDPARQQSPRENEVVTLARILWVDDHPDNDLCQTRGREPRTLSSTVATSTGSAMTYLDELDFALAITDLGRGPDDQAGIDFIREPWRPAALCRSSCTQRMQRERKPQFWRPVDGLPSTSPASSSRSSNVI
jgi:hypothetical protein